MIIYKTTNKLNGKIYIGKDKHNDPTYLGSGIYLKNAIKKYKKENFVKEIICECESMEDANEKEKYWIKTLNSCDKKIGYNIAHGGDGGDTITNNPNREVWLQKKKNKIPWNKGKKSSKESVDKMKSSKKKFFEENPDKKTNSGSFKPGRDHVLYGKKRDRGIVDKIISSRMKNDGYKNNNPTNAQISSRKPIIVEDTTTGVKTKYESISDAIKELNIPRISMTCMLRNKYKTGIRRKYKNLKFYYDN